MEHNKLIFSKVPTLRFRFNNDKWAEYPNSVLFSISSKKNHDGKESLVLSASQEKGMIPRNQNGIDIKYSEESVFTYKIIENGDYVIHLRSFQGGFAISRFNGICSPAYTVLKPNKEILSNGFLENYFTSKKFIDSLRTVTFGIRDGKSISVDQWMTQSLFIPSKNEQEKIIAFIQKINSRIEVQNKIISKYETLIKGISCDSFSKQPNHIAKLKDLIIKGKAGGTPSSAVAEYYNGDIPFLSISDMTKQGKYVEFTEKHISENGLGNSSAWIVPPNSLILSMYASVGLVCINKVPLATSQAMFSMVLKDSNMLDYIYYYLNFFRETQIHRLLETGTQSNINADTVRDIEIPFYSNILVFVKTLQAIENRLNNEKDMLSRLMDLKTYLLSSLFI